MKKHFIYFSLISVIFLTGVFMFGEIFFKTIPNQVTQYIPPASTQVAAVADFDSNLVAHYTFDNGTASDTSGHGNNGTVSGATPVEGKISQGLNFDGSNDYVNLGPPSSLTALTYPYTISLWYKTTNRIVGQTLFSFDVTDSNSDAIIMLTYLGSGNRINAGSSVVPASYTIPSNAYDGSWHHVVMTRDASNNPSLYFDGSAMSRTTDEYYAISGLRIGARGTGQYPFNGSIDDVRIYSRPLDISDVQQLYTLGSGSITTIDLDTTPPSTPTGSYTLYLTKSGTGQGTITGGSINCGSTCTQSNITSGTSVTLIATPQSGSTFTGWSGGCSGTGNCTMTVNANTMVTARFDIEQVVNGICEAVAGNTCWYVDNTATGSNNGTSWTNAWTTIKGINWTSVSPGDFVYISGGASGSSQTYAGILRPLISGTASKLITIKVGQDSNHNGLVIIDGQYSNTNIGWYGIQLNNVNYITVTGKVGNDTAPHIKVIHSYYDGIFINGNIVGFHLAYIDVTQNGSPDASIVYGMRVTVGQAQNLGEIDHMKFHDNKTDEMDFLKSDIYDNSVSYFGSLKIHDNEIYDWHADASKIGLGGVDYYNNTVRDRGVWHADHPDGIQFYGSYVRIFNNHFYNFNQSGTTANSYLRYNPYYIPADANNNPKYVYIYNNLFEESGPPLQEADGGGNLLRGIEMSLSRNELQSLSHVYIANNTFVNVPYFAISFSFNANNSGIQNANQVSDVVIANNIIKDSAWKTVATNSSGPLIFQRGNGSITYGGWGSSASVIVDYNSIFASSPTTITNVDYYAGSGDTLYSYAQWKNICTGCQAHDTTSDPMVGSNLYPLSGSPLIDSGISVSSIFSTDFANTIRPYGLAWDIGAYEYTGVILTSSKYILSLTKSGTGSGNVAGGSVNCGSICTQFNINPGTTITLTATPQSGSTFMGWSGGGCSGTESCSVTFNTNTTVTATFTQQAVASPLVLHLDFATDWSSSHTVQDTSGSANNATCQTTFTVLNANLYGHVPQVITTNQCPTKTTGPKTGMSAATFNGQVCRIDSKYLSIQPSASINNLTQGTITLWAYYNPSTDPLFTFDTIWTYQKLVDSYVNGIANTWSFGKNFLNNTVFLVQDNTGVGHSFPITFPDDKVNSSWHYYTVTWDGSNFKGYYDGNLIGTTPQTGISKLVLGKYLAIGASAHGNFQNEFTNNCVNQYQSDINQYGYPTDQQYFMPNSGFLEGKLADVRIYNTALSANQIASLYNGDSDISITPIVISGDFNSDGSVNALDFSAMKVYWNQSNTTYDLNKDGIVNSLDFSIMATHWTG